MVMILATTIMMAVAMIMVKAVAMAPWRGVMVAMAVVTTMRASTRQFLNADGPPI